MAKEFSVWFRKQDGDCSNVEIRVDVNVSHECSIYTATIDAHTPAFAEIVADHLTRSLANTMETIRRRNYERGWKDAKAKRTKKSWFSNRLLARDDE